MDRKVIFESRFNIYFLGKIDYTKKYNDKNERDLNWIKNRVEITKKYCLPSLINQTNQNFIAYFKCRKENLDYIKNLLGDMPQNIKFIDWENYKEQLMGLTQTHALYEIRVDSDDAWDKDIVNKIYNIQHKEDTQILINQGCYNYDIYRKLLMKFYHLSPQSYVLIYKKGSYVNSRRINKGHTRAIELKHEIIEGYNYLDTVHGKNIQSKYWTESSKMLKIIGEVEKKSEVLKRFGIHE
jgi:hypothetical protein